MKILVTFIISILSFSAYTQKVKTEAVPATVRAAFENQFKEIKNVHWEKEKGDFYEAEFILDKKETSATFASDGALFETETEISLEDLPKNVKPYIIKNYPGYKISEASLIIDVAGAKKYEAEIKKMGKHRDLIFDAQGNIVK